MTDQAPLKVKEIEKSAWAAVLQHGISGWSSYTDTGEAGDRHVEEDGEHATSAPRAAGDSDAKPGDAQKPGLPRQGTSGDLSKKAKEGEDGDDEKPGKGDGKGKAPALDAGWKQYRRDVEWQCRWLELRMKEIGGHIARYKRMLRGIERAKERQAEEKTGDVATDVAGPSDAENEKPDAEKTDVDETDAPMDKESGKSANTVGAPKMKRRRVPHADAPTPPPPVLVAHPLFNETRRKKKNDKEDDVKTTAQRKRLKVDFRNSERERQLPVAEPHDTEGSDSDLSTAALYEQIEVLQQRVTALHARLGQPAPAMHTSGAVASAAARAGGPTGLGGKLSGLPAQGQWGYGAPLPTLKKQASRKDDFDINNVVGAAPTGAKFVERAQHVDICTPVVRPAPEYNPAVGTGNAPVDDDVSSEDTSDETYVRRHAKFEVAERTARTLPEKKTGRGGEKGKEEKSTGGGKVAAAAAAKEKEDDADSKRANTEAAEGGAATGGDLDTSALAG